MEYEKLDIWYVWNVTISQEETDFFLDENRYYMLSHI